MTTTAEDVETSQQQKLLRALGCPAMQGHLFSGPKRAAEIEELLYAHPPGPMAVSSGRKRRPAKVS